MTNKSDRQTTSDDFQWLGENIKSKDEWVNGDDHMKATKPSQLCAKHEGKFVIGTCEGCQHWIGEPRQSRYGLCLKRQDEDWALDDGCKYWKEKEKQ